MKTIYAIILVFLISVIFSTTISAEEITEANYLKVDQKIWGDYENCMEEIGIELKNNPEKRDSLLKVAKELLNIASQKNIATAIKYASVPSGLQRLFMVRLNMPKSQLKSVIATLPDSLGMNSYYRSIQQHIVTHQPEIGDKYIDLEFTNLAGKNVKLSSFIGKQILLISGGLSCMGDEGVKYLKDIYSKTSRKDFEIIIFCLCRKLSELKDIQNIYSCPFPLVSDMKNDQSSLKILYGAQSTPTCFVIEKDGTLSYKNTGVRQSELNAIILGITK
ncbi:MAG: redoxin domain-containing protein [Muribaculaceae bacterium]